MKSTVVVVLWLQPVQFLELALLDPHASKAYAILLLIDFCREAIGIVERVSFIKASRKRAQALTGAWSDVSR